MGEIKIINGACAAAGVLLDFTERERETVIYVRYMPLWYTPRYPQEKHTHNTS